MNQESWQPPIVHKINNQSEFDELVVDTGTRQISDSAQYIAEDLFELRNPALANDELAKEAFVSEALAEGVRFGNWVQYPWADSLVRFPEEDDYYDMRTFRNRDLLTKDEQQQLRHKKIAAFGMSVGSNVVDRLVQTGIGNNYMLFDYDRLSPANLNRIWSSMGSVGLHKTLIEGRKIAELDPYAEQQHFTDGYTAETDDIIRRQRPDVIVEEVDDISAKARLRRLAQELRIPLVMAGDVGDVSTLDVERYDLDPDTKPFNGQLSKAEYQALLNGELEDKDGALMKMVGIKNLTPRLIKSVMLRDVELAGVPQLGSTATIGGALASVAIRDILLGRGPVSANSAVNIRKVVGAKPASSLMESIATIKEFIEYRKESSSDR